MSEFRKYIRSAMFVDFDNISITYSSEDQILANLFATKPEKWLEWIEKQMPSEHVGDGTERRVLVRRCYMNPVVFAQHRPFFTRAGFEVIDCPPLTSRGKTSTDIHMVMDMMDTLDHMTHFDEFIILSGDADFTPVLLRLRKYDRSTSVLAAGYVSPAYKAAADYVIDQETFVREAIGFNEPETEIPITEAESSENKQLAPFIDKIVDRLEEVINESGPIQAVDLPRFYREVTELNRKSNWLGCGTLRRLTEVIVAHSVKLTITREDPWRVDLLGTHNNVLVDTITHEANIGEEVSSPCERPIHELVEDTIRMYISGSPQPVSMPKMADILTKKFGWEMVESAWLGRGSFTNLLKTLNLPEIHFTNGSPPYLYIPDIHRSALESKVDETMQRDDLPAKIHKITDVPLISTEHYAVLFKELVKEIKDNEFNLNVTSKSVRDHCVEKGYSISRNTVNFVINGLVHVGVKFRLASVEHHMALAEKFYENVLNLCANAQLPLSEDEKNEVHDWIVGKHKNPIGSSLTFEHLSDGDNKTNRNV